MQNKINTKRFFLFALLATGGVQAANTNTGVFAAYTYINDLGISLQDGQTGSAISRSGLKLGADFNWADMNYQGGTTVSVFANQDNDLSDNRNISNLGLMVSRIKPLSNRWLSRSSFMLEQYRNHVVESTGYNGLGLNLTAGYMGDNQQGVDLSLKVMAEDHNQDALDLYRTIRTELGMTYYFPRQPNQPFWEAQLRWQNNQANNDYRDYDSTLLGLAYKGWHKNDWWGNLRFQRRQDDYRITTPQSRQDTLYFAAVDLFKMLDKQWQFRASFSAGLYDSNLLTSTQNYLQMSAGVQMRF